MEGLSTDRSLTLACEASNRGQLPSKQACAAAVAVKISTLKGRLKGVKPRTEIEANLKKLSNNNELVLNCRISELDS